MLKGPLLHDPESGGEKWYRHSLSVHAPYIVYGRALWRGTSILLAARLATHGYSRVHSRIQLRLVGHFNRWLANKHLTAEQLDEDVIECYRLQYSRDIWRLPP
jgi:hypothetical protein